MHARELMANPKFVALWMAVWGGTLLALVNSYEKISLLAQLAH